MDERDLVAVRGGAPFILSIAAWAALLSVKPKADGSRKRQICMIYLVLR